ncbi:LiaF transmembrane domain-containing protein [Pseudoclavibacter sp. 13-3]|uniref:LiaF transmembrane domain-containing protein n=1 Tax=Pseudoclavibacter sp. 13-3 TaxID=2901228 RepID=UPI001E4BB04A|nr:LiaF domain-containing protein [Pseudoclavibacter sp. 13-3]MCD7100636.1 cell wall-active antibiotics response protein [Pseudoclavibacter sp. 13-3]
MRTVSSRIIAGLVIVGVGLVLLANVVIPDFQMGSVFRLIIGIAVIALGVSTLLSSWSNLWWALALLVVGVALILDNFGLLPFSPWALIAPAAVIALGLSVLTRRRPKAAPSAASAQGHASCSGVAGSAADAGRFGAPSGDAALDQNVTAVLGGSEVRSTAHGFRSASMTAVLGSSTLDLTRAVLAPEVRIDVLAFMGGLEIRIPDGARVRVEATALLGGVEDRSVFSVSAADPSVAATAPVVVIGGQVMLGSLEIRN